MFKYVCVMSTIAASWQHADKPKFKEAQTYIARLQIYI